jgi:hypothetical protein
MLLEYDTPISARPNNGRTIEQYLTCRWREKSSNTVQ